MTWGDQTQRSLDALSFSGRQLGQLPSLVRALAQVKVAAAGANVEAGVLDVGAGSAIADAAAGLVDHPDELVADPLAGGGAIAVHVNVNEVVAHRSGRPATEVAASQSTADVVHTAARLAVAEDHDRLRTVVVSLEAELAATADRFGSAPTLARTCLQDGLEVEARLLLDGSGGAIGRARRALDDSVAALCPPTLGSTVVGTGAGASDAYRAAVIAALAVAVGRPLAPAPDPASALQHGDDLVAVSSAALRLAQAVAKLARDLRLLSSGPHGGFGEVRLPAVMDGSTFFAGKVNPVVPETVVQAAILVEGLDTTVRAATREAELHLQGYDLAVAVAVLDELAVLRRAIRHLTRHAIAGASFDVVRGAELAALARPLK